MKKLIKVFLIISSVFLSFSCSKKDEKTSAEISYLKAMKSLEDRNYSEAAEEFVKIDDEFPFSKWAIRAQTMAVYCYYKEDEYDKLTQIVDDFVRLQPASEYVPYMIYMKGLSYYNKIPDIERAQDDTQIASSTFRELIARFGESEYAHDAKEKLDFVDEHLAGAKMSTGRYQMKNLNFVGALRNFTEVIYRYRNTKQVPEAYFRSIELYQKLGMKKEAEIIFVTLKENFPENYWAKKANP